MTLHTRIVAAAAAGCLVGSLFTVQLVRGQAARPLDGNLSHISFSVRDADKTAKAFADLFGVPAAPAKTYRDIPWGPDFPGKVYHGKVAQVRVNNVGFEFIEPVDSESPWSDFITQKGEGLHHVGFSVADAPAAVQWLRAKGGKQTQKYLTTNYVDMHGAGVPTTFEVTGGFKPAAPAK